MRKYHLSQHVERSNVKLLAAYILCGKNLRDVSSRFIHEATVLRLIGSHFGGVIAVHRTKPVNCRIAGTDRSCGIAVFSLPVIFFRFYKKQLLGARAASHTGLLGNNNVSYAACFNKNVIAPIGTCDAAVSTSENVDDSLVKAGR